MDSPLVSDKVEGIAQAEATAANLFQSFLKRGLRGVDVQSISPNHSLRIYSASSNRGYMDYLQTIEARLVVEESTEWEKAFDKQTAFLVGDFALVTKKMHDNQGIGPNVLACFASPPATPHYLTAHLK